MAQKVQITLVDDLDGSAADETVAFTLDGVGYQIDLSAANAARLRDAMAPWVGHARKVRGAGGATKRRARGGDSRSAQIRQWAREQGLAVNERGRIPADLAARYDAGH
jgi:hypothetical protein